MLTWLAIFVLATPFFSFVFLAAPALAQQSADPEFKATVAHPAYSKAGPRVLFDEAHNNFHTTTGRYKPFADLITEDGYYVVPSRKSFTRESLATFKVMVIANALGAEDVDDEGADHSAFTDEECDSVREWVRNGGAMLLTAGQAPFGGAAENLAKRFGVDMSKGNTIDEAHTVADLNNSGLVIYSRENGLLLDHPITQGRNDAEKISRVMAITGQSLKGPEGSGVFLKLSDTAIDKMPAPGKDVSAAGRALGLAFKFGKGRVVVLAEPSLISAQITGREKSPLGMNYPGVDNRQLALNVMHWLSGLSK